MVRVVDSVGNEDPNTNTVHEEPAPTITVSLETGWNLISLPWLTSLASIGDALNGISWGRAMVYQNGHWYTYNTAWDAKFNIAFPMVDNTMGIWVHASSSGSITYEEPSVTSTDIPLHEGWNLIGYPSNTADTVSNVMSGFTGTYDIIQMYNRSSGDIITLADSDIMQYGYAYWVHATSEGTLTVDW